jgi:hypothetical protein
LVPTHQGASSRLAERLKFPNRTFGFIFDLAFDFAFDLAFGLVFDLTFELTFDHDRGLLWLEDSLAFKTKPIPNEKNSRDASA